ncbi:MAG: transcription elongation GreA/GreB family factor [Saprospiraceae bacterium]|jgi:transcription elongation GreA/GreB family factor
MNKENIWQSTVNPIEVKINLSRKHLKGLKDSSASDTKSSAGDKFETSREMMQQEITKAEIHLAQLLSQLEILNAISPLQQSKEVGLGSFVITNKGSFYISTSIGKVKNEDGFFFCISTESPMGAALLGLKNGENTKVNGNKIEVLEIL